MIMEPIWITTIVIKDGELSTSQRLDHLDMFIEEMAKVFNEDYGAGNWVIMATDELPDDFSGQDYDIMGGQLIRSSAERIMARKADATAAHNEQQRISREAEYRRLTDIKVMELMSEANPEIAAIKATIREKYPYITN